MPAKLLDGVVPHGKNRCRLQLLFLCLIVTDPHSPVVVLIYSVDAIPLWLTVGLLQMQSIGTPSFTDFCSRATISDVKADAFST